MYHCSNLLVLSKHVVMYSIKKTLMTVVKLTFLLAVQVSSS